MRFRITALISLVLLTTFVCAAQNEKIQKCSVPKGVGGKYKLIFEARPLGEPKTVLVDVVIKPKNFTKQYMTEFAERVKAEYCNEDWVGIAIFDSKKAQLGWHYDFVISGGKVERRRGTYLLERKIGREGIEFSTKPGNPINEVRIELKSSN